MMQYPTLLQIVSAYSLVRQCRQIASSGALDEQTEGTLRDRIAEVEKQFMLPTVADDASQDNTSLTQSDRITAVVGAAMNGAQHV